MHAYYFSLQTLIEMTMQQESGIWPGDAELDALLDGLANEENA